MPIENATKKSESTYALLSDLAEVPNAMTPPWYYNFLIKLAKPFYRISLWRRYEKAKKSQIQTADYHQEINERYGRQYPEPPVLSPEQSLDIEENPFKDTLIWCHAVSLGETNTIAPMLHTMLRQGARIWLTNTTQTGYARSETIFADAIQSKQMVHTFVPIDDEKVIKRFVSHVKPNIVMFVETELWANMLAELNRNGIPSVLVNARLSQKSFENYQKYESVSKSIVHNITMIIAQDADSAKRFRRLGTEVPKIRLANSLKWSSDTTVSKSANEWNTLNNSDDISAKFTHNKQSLNRPIWVAGSTHEGEENKVISAHKQIILQPSLDNALLIIVPRHPERFDEVADLLAQSGLVYHRRSKDELITNDTQVYLADTMGELTDCYQLADVAFVGGSLVNVGGHNPIEAASLAKPILMGRYTQSCHELVSALSNAGALKVVEYLSSEDSYEKTLERNGTEYPDSLVDTLSYWLNNPTSAKKAGAAGRNLVSDKSNAMQRQLLMIEALLVETLLPRPLTSPEYNQVDLDHFKVRALYENRKGKLL